MDGVASIERGSKISAANTITICGGGLSGLSLGIALRQSGVPVVLREAGSYPRHRVCGEFISGVSDETLEILGILPCFDPSIRLVESQWFAGEDEIVSQKLPCPARGLSRFYLDKVLADEFVNLGGKLLCKSRCELKNAGKEGTIWAAGRPANRGRKWLGLKVHLRGFDLRSDLEMHLGNGAYLGISRVEDGKVNACGLFRPQTSIKGKNSALLLSYLRATRLNALAARLESAIPDEASFSAVAGFEMGWQETDDDLLGIGDAFSMIPPFTGNGMSMAFESAAIALPPLVAYAKNDLAWNEARRAVRIGMRTQFKDRLRIAGGLHKAMLGGIGQSVTVAMARRNLLPFNWLFERLRSA